MSSVRLYTLLLIFAVFDVLTSADRFSDTFPMPISEPDMESRDGKVFYYYYSHSLKLFFKNCHRSNHFKYNVYCIKDDVNPGPSIQGIVLRYKNVSINTNSSIFAFC